jgi:hypothetical protein
MGKVNFAKHHTGERRYLAPIAYTEGVLET